MIDLSNLSPALGSNRAPKRLGRGPGSGTGKTAGKGHKGQKARKSGGIRPGYEGGQTPLYRRIPKHGFKNLASKKNYVLVKVGDLNSFAAGSEVNLSTLSAAGLVRGKDPLVKIVGGGELKVSNLKVSVHAATKSVREAVGKLGGTFAEK